MLAKKSRRQAVFVILSQVLGEFGSGIFSFGLSFLLLDKTGSVYSFALSAMVAPLVGLILLPVVGPLVDKFSHKKIIILSQSVTVAALLIFWWWISVFPQHLFGAAVLLIIVLRMSDQFTSVARAASNRELVGPAELAKVVQFSSMASSVSGLVTSILGATLYSLLPFAVFILLELTMEIATAIITLSLDFHLVAAEHATSIGEKTFTAFKQGLSYLRRQKYLVFGLVMALVVNFFSGLFSVGLPVLALKVLAVPNVYYGFIEGSLAVGMILGAAIYAKLPPVTEPLVNLQKLCLVVGILQGIVGFIPLLQSTILPTLLLCLLLILFGIVIMRINIPYNVWLQRDIPSKWQGRILSVVQTLGMVVSPVGVYLFGVLFDLKTASLTGQTSLIFAISGLTVIVLVLLVSKMTRLNLHEATIFADEDE